MIGSDLTENQVQTRIDAHKEDVTQFSNRLQSPEDEEHAKSLREGIARSYRKLSGLSASIGDDEETARSLEKATEWYLKHVEAVAESPELALSGSDGVVALLDLVEVAVLHGDEDARTEASQRCLSTTVEDTDGHEDYLACAKAFAALAGDADVEERLDALDGDRDDVPEFVAGATECIRGVHEERSDAVVSGIERVLESHAEGENPKPYDAVSLDALALFVLARERSLVEHDDISAHRELLPEYQPGGD